MIDEQWDEGWIPYCIGEDCLEGGEGSCRFGRRGGLCGRPWCLGARGALSARRWTRGRQEHAPGDRLHKCAFDFCSPDAHLLGVTGLHLRQEGAVWNISRGRLALWPEEDNIPDQQSRKEEQVNPGAYPRTRRLLLRLLRLLLLALRLLRVRHGIG